MRSRHKHLERPCHFGAWQPTTVLSTPSETAMSSKFYCQISQKLLSEQQKKTRLEVRRQLLHNYEHDKDYLERILNGDENMDVIKTNQQTSPASVCG